MSENSSKNSLLHVHVLTLDFADLDVMGGFLSPNRVYSTLNKSDVISLF